MSEITYKELKGTLTEEIKRDSAEYNGYKIWINKKYKNDAFINFLDNIASEFECGEVIKSGRNTLVKIEKDPGKGIPETIIIKRFNLLRKYDRLRFRFIKSKAYRSLIIALALQKINIKTPTPVATIDKRNPFNQLLCSYYISEYVPYDYNLKTCIQDHKGVKEKKSQVYIRIIANQLQKMHKAGIIHNDLSLSNILVVEGNVPEFYFIDLNRARIKIATPLCLQVRDLTRIHFGSRFQKIVFCKVYNPQYYKIVFDLMHIFRMRNKRKRFIKKTFRKLRKHTSNKS